MLNKLLLQLEQLYDALDPILIPGILYLAIRGWKHMKRRGGAVGIPLLLCLSYIALFSLAAGGWVQERYYRPIIPFAAILAGMGYHCLIKDFSKNKKVLYTLMFLVLAACLWDGLEEPIRQHRRPQTVAGKWLHGHDPNYTGFVVSNDTQPVHYAGMKYFNPECPESLFRDLNAAGYEFKYVILDGDDDEWHADLVSRDDWPCIYRENERNIRIYQNPESDS